MKDISIREERLSAEAYIEFLKHSDPGSQYPSGLFEERISRLVESVPVSLSARESEDRLVGVLFALTDYACWLFITGLALTVIMSERGSAGS